MNIDVNAFCMDLREVLDRYKVVLGVDIEGDTHGIRTDFVVIDSANNQLTLSACDCYLYANDLNDFLGVEESGEAL